MKKFLFLLVVAGVVYKFFPQSLPFLSSGGAFDKDGKPLVIVFVGPECGTHCDNVLSTLHARKIAFEEINTAGPDGAPVRNAYNISRYPTTLIGKQEILGDDIPRLSAALAEAYGIDTLPRMERLAMANHFDAEGRPKVVMYGTAWCGYCKQQREYFATHGVDYDDINVETSDAGQLAYRALQGGGYPLIYVGFRRFQGFHGQDLLDTIAEQKKSKPIKLAAAS